MGPGGTATAQSVSIPVAAARWLRATVRPCPPAARTAISPPRRPDGRPFTLGLSQRSAHTQKRYRQQLQPNQAHEQVQNRITGEQSSHTLENASCVLKGPPLFFSCVRRGVREINHKGISFLFQRRPPLWLSVYEFLEKRNAAPIKSHHGPTPLAA